MFNRELVEQVSLEFVRSTLSDLKQTLQEQSVLIKQRRRAIGAQTRVISEPLDELDDILGKLLDFSILERLLTFSHNSSTGQSFSAHSYSKLKVRCVETASWQDDN